jgi:adenine-specific DNA-methyltransferase
MDCEKCGAKFATNSAYKRHLSRKTPCTKVAQIARNIAESSFEELCEYYDLCLNTDNTGISSNDEPTPINCVNAMISKIPAELWSRENLQILDPCCGNGNFFIPIFFELLKYNEKRAILEQILEFNDINKNRLNNVRTIFASDTYNLNINCVDFLTSPNLKKYDLIVANPPYAKLLENGKRASKNHNLIKDFIEMALSQLKPDGYLLFLTPDNWMSCADRNLLIKIITSLQIIHLDIHSAKKYFKKIGSSFTYYVIQNCPSYKDINITGLWKGIEYESSVVSQIRDYIPLLYDQTIQSILSKTIDTNLPKFAVKTSSDLHKFTKAQFIQSEKSKEYCYKLIHTPKQTVYSNRAHKFQDGYKVFISTTDKYGVFVDNCGMTQSIVFILCDSEEQAQIYARILIHPLYRFINNICRWGNFNNIRVLQRFPIPECDFDDIYVYFGITKNEINYIGNMI